MHPVWNFWTGLYLALALTALGFSSLDRWRRGWIGGLILLASWAMTNGVGASHAPEKSFLIYFVFDCVAVEIVAFQLFRQAWWWQAIFLVCLACQLTTHLWFWGYEPPPRRYHEILNAFFWVKAVAICFTSRMVQRQVVSDAWLGPREVFEKSVDLLIIFRPRTAPGQPRNCPTIIRAWA